VEQFRALLSGTSLKGTSQAAALDIPAWTAPASGLFLEGIKYPEKLDNKLNRRVGRSEVLET
jgi:hypothetical protein